MKIERNCNSVRNIIMSTDIIVLKNLNLLEYFILFNESLIGMYMGIQLNTILKKKYMPIQLKK